MKDPEEEDEHTVSDKQADEGIEEGAGIYL